MAEALVRARDRGLDAMNAWLRDRGESALKAGGGVFMWGAAAHAVYLVAVPEPLRPVVARRNARRAMGCSIAALLAVGAYDILQSARINSERAALAAEYRRLTRAAAELDSSGGGGGNAPPTGPHDDDDG